MQSSIKALYLGAKVTEFESSRYLKVFLSVRLKMMIPISLVWMS